MTDAIPYNISRITERLFIGGVIKTVDEIAYLKAQGVTHVLSVAYTLDDHDICKEFDLKFRHILWADDKTAKDVNDFRTALSWLLDYDAKHAQDNALSVVYVHCFKGHNRSPMMATFLLAALAGFNADHAYSIVHTARPTVESFDHPAYRASVIRALKAILPTYKAELDVTAPSRTKGAHASATQ